MLLRLSWFILLMISTPTTIFCQVSEDVRVSISGVVQDQDRSRIVRAQVELRRDAVVIQSTLSDDAGHFRFNKISIGDYHIQVTSPGFEAAIAFVKVGALPIDSISITMSVGSIHQETTITNDNGRTSTDAGANQSAISLTGDALGDLPVFDQDYVAALSRFIDPASVGTNGVSLVVNGVEANSVTVSPSAIKEVKINQNPYSAEFTRPGQGRFQVETKQVETVYHGTFNFIFRDAHLNARDDFAQSFSERFCKY